MSQAKCKARPVGKLRAGSYPIAGDQLDAIWKILMALPEDALADAPPDARAVMETVQAVKATFPKRPRKKPDGGKIDPA
jgi:hypothetical protein